MSARDYKAALLATWSVKRVGFKVIKRAACRELFSARRHWRRRISRASDAKMKIDAVCVALLCALTVLAQVHAAPTDVNAGQLVDRLKQLLRQRHAKVSAVLYAFVIIVYTTLV